MSHDSSAGPRRAFAHLLTGEYPIALWAIFLLALGLRVYHASNHSFTADEVPNIRIAETIRLSLSEPHLVFRSQGHPLLIVYMTHFSSLVFGKSLLGYRAAMVLMGALTCLALYRVGKEVDSKSVGLWAAALIAVDQFHVTRSGSLNSHEIPLVLFGTLALLSCARIAPQGDLRPFIGMGAWMGLAYLGKETALMLFPALWGFMLLSKERRAVLTDPRWYLAHLVFAAVVAPDIIWNLAHASDGGYMQESYGKAFGGTAQIQFKALSLFIGELFMMVDPNVLGGRSEYWWWPNRTMYWVAGLLYLYCTLWAWRFRRKPIVLLLQLAFLVTVLVVTVMPGKQRFDPFWWASMAMSPAIILSGLYLSEWVRRTRRSLWVIVPLLVWLLGRTVQTLSGVPFFQDGRC